MEKLPAVARETLEQLIRQQGGSLARAASEGDHTSEFDFAVQGAIPGESVLAAIRVFPGEGRTQTPGIVNPLFGRVSAPEVESPSAPPPASIDIPSDPIDIFELHALLSGLPTVSSALQRFIKSGGEILESESGEGSYFVAPISKKSAGEIHLDAAKDPYVGDRIQAIRNALERAHELGHTEAGREVLIRHIAEELAPLFGVAPEQIANRLSGMGIRNIRRGSSTQKKLEDEALAELFVAVTGKEIGETLDAHPLSGNERGSGLEETLTQSRALYERLRDALDPQKAGGVLELVSDLADAIGERKPAQGEKTYRELYRTSLSGRIGLSLSTWAARTGMVFGMFNTEQDARTWLRKRGNEVRLHAPDTGEAGEAPEPDGVQATQDSPSLERTTSGQIPRISAKHIRDAGKRILRSEARVRGAKLLEDTQIRKLAKDVFELSSVLAKIKEDGYTVELGDKSRYDRLRPGKRIVISPDVLSAEHKHEAIALELILEYWQAASGYRIQAAPKSRLTREQFIDHNMKELKAQLKNARQTISRNKYAKERIHEGKVVSKERLSVDYDTEEAILAHVLGWDEHSLEILSAEFGKLYDGQPSEVAVPGREGFVFDDHHLDFLCGGDRTLLDILTSGRTAAAIARSEKLTQLLQWAYRSGFTLKTTRWFPLDHGSVDIEARSIEIGIERTDKKRSVMVDQAGGLTLTKQERLFLQTLTNKLTVAFDAVESPLPLPDGFDSQQKFVDAWVARHMNGEILGRIEEMEFAEGIARFGRLSPSRWRRDEAQKAYDLFKRTGDRTVLEKIWGDAATEYGDQTVRVRRIYQLTSEAEALWKMHRAADEPAGAVATGQAAEPAALSSWRYQDVRLDQYLQAHESWRGAGLDMVEIVEQSEGEYVLTLKHRNYPHGIKSESLHGRDGQLHWNGKRSRFLNERSERDLLRIREAIESDQALLGRPYIYYAEDDGRIVVGVLDDVTVPVPKEQMLAEVDLLITIARANRNSPYRTMLSGAAALARANRMALQERIAPSRGSQRWAHVLFRKNPPQQGNDYRQAVLRENAYGYHVYHHQVDVGDLIVPGIQDFRHAGPAAHVILVARAYGNAWEEMASSDIGTALECLTGRVPIKRFTRDPAAARPA
jgi:hypothetical protein